MREGRERWRRREESERDFEREGRRGREERKEEAVRRVQSQLKSLLRKVGRCRQTAQCTNAHGRTRTL